jgi:hypothetical protein
MVEAHKQMAELKTKILLRNDTALNWSSVNPILGKGELGIEIDTGLLKIGDGVTTWSALSYFKGDLSDYYTKEQVNTLFENVDADKVFFGKDLIFTKEFGKYVPDSTGSVTIPTSTNKMSLQDLLENAFAEELDPETTDPTLTLNSSNIGEKEVGTKIKVAYSYTSTAGSYTYGPETGVTWSNHKATFNGQTLSGTSGTFNEVQVTDSTNLSISGSADHSEGAMPVTNLGNDYADGKIAAETGVTASKGTLKGYRKLFCGTMTTKETTLSSANIRGLSGKAEKAKARNAEKKANGDELREVVQSVLTDEFQTIDAIVAQIEGEEITKAKVTARLTSLVNNGIAEKADVKDDEGRKLKAYKLVA